MKRLFIIAAALAATLLSASAQESVTVHVAGQSLESLLTEEQKQSVRSLTVTGTLAEAEYAYLRSGLLNQLDTLNLRQAEIDTIPKGAFYCELKYDLSFTRYMILPETLVHLSEHSLCIWGREVMAIITGRYPSLGGNVFNAKLSVPTGDFVKMDVSPDNPYLRKIGYDIYSTDGKTLYYWGGDDIQPGTEILAGHLFENILVIEGADLRIPNTIDSIGDRAFANIVVEYYTGTKPRGYDGSVPGTTFVCETKVPPALGKDVFGFDGYPSDYGFSSYIEVSTLYVPDESIGLYSTAPGWSAFKNIKGLSGLVSGIESAQSAGSGIVIEKAGGKYIVRSAKAIKSVDCFGVDGVLMSSCKNINEQFFEISADELPYGSMKIVRIVLSDGTSETLKLRL